MNAVLTTITLTAGYYLTRNNRHFLECYSGWQADFNDRLLWLIEALPTEQAVKLIMGKEPR